MAESTDTKTNGLKPPIQGSSRDPSTAEPTSKLTIESSTSVGSKSQQPSPVVMSRSAPNSFDEDQHSHPSGLSKHVHQASALALSDNAVNMARKPYESDGDLPELHSPKGSGKKKKKKARFLSLRSHSNSSSPSVTSSRANPEISVEHREYEVTYDMMLGIRTMVGLAYGHTGEAELTKEDFSFVQKRSFPKNGSKNTPAHKMRDFKFKDYSPEVFRQLRDIWGLDAAEYTMTITNNHYLEFISNSKSGQFFFYTYDKRFMIKTMSKAECKFIRQILPQYFDYVRLNPHTLLTRFYGIHRVKPSGSEKMRFLIMGSVFYTDKYIHECYDLKGSTHGRAATEKEKRQEVPVLKDLDFLDKKVKIQIHPIKAKTFIEQLRKDAEFLASLHIMDYSLLLGMHFVDRPVPLDGPRAVSDQERLSSIPDGMLKLPEPSPAKELLLMEKDQQQIRQEFLESKNNAPIFRRQSHYGLKGGQGVIAAGTPTIDPILPLGTDDMKFEKFANLPKIESMFQTDFGGVKGVASDGTDSGLIYFMGIIDILQTYTMKKQAEHLIRGIQFDSTTISAVSPAKYASRFVNFIEAAVVTAQEDD